MRARQQTHHQKLFQRNIFCQTCQYLCFPLPEVTHCLGGGASVSLNLPLTIHPFFSLPLSSGSRDLPVIPCPPGPLLSMGRRNPGSPSFIVHKEKVKCRINCNGCFRLCPVTHFYTGGSGGVRVHAGKDGIVLCQWIWFPLAAPRNGSPGCLSLTE